MRPSIHSDVRSAERGPFSLRALAADRALDPASRAARWGDAFLVQLGGVLRRPLYGGTGDADTNEEAAADGADFSVARVWPVRHHGRSSFPHVTLGRSPTNDLVVGDVSVSKIHAYFVRQNEHLAIQDAGSANGTRVDDRRVPRRAEGPPVALHSGARLELGSVDVVFLLAPELWALVENAVG